MSAGLEWREPKRLNAREQHPSPVDWAFLAGYAQALRLGAREGNASRS